MEVKLLRKLKQLRTRALCNMQDYIKKDDLAKFIKVLVKFEDTNKQIYNLEKKEKLVYLYEENVKLKNLYRKETKKLKERIKDLEYYRIMALILIVIQAITIWVMWLK